MTIENKKVSIILPIYNVGKYLERCLKTIESQTYENFEAILVNDGSTDNCLDICQSFYDKDKRFKIVNQENAGVSAARNAGLENVDGEYITFIDPDDAVTDDYIETLVTILQKYSADISMCGIRTLYKEVPFVRDDSTNVLLIMNTTQALEKLLYQDEYDVGLWGKLYRSHLFDGIKFPTGEINEDTAVTYKVFSRIQRAVFTKQKCYFYLQHNSSIMNSSFSRKKMSLISFSNECLKFISKEYPEIRAAAVCKHVTDAFVLLCKIYEAKEIDEESLAECWTIIRKYRLEVILNGKARKKTKIACVASYFGPRFVAWSKSINSDVNRLRGERKV